MRQDAKASRESELSRANAHALGFAYGVGLSAQSGARAHVPRRHARRG